MLWDKEALEVIHTLECDYFEKRDMDAVLSSLDEHVTWIGTGEHEICNGYEEAKRVLLEEKRVYPNGFTIADSHYQIFCLSESICIAYGNILAYYKDSSLAELNNRVSLVLIKKDGKIRLIHLHLSNPDHFQKEGDFYVKKSVLRDNMSLKKLVEQTTEELKARNWELEAMTENIPGGVHCCLNDPWLTLISISESFFAMFGYTKAEIQERFQSRFLLMIHPDDRAYVLQEAKKQLDQNSTLELEYRIVNKKGETIWILDKGKMFTTEDGTQTIYCLLVDISERKKVQEELRLSLERHQVIMDQATDIIFEWDIPRDTLLFSPNWQKKFGYCPVNTNISRRIPISSNIHENDMAAFIKIMRDTASGVPYSETNFRIKTSIGAYIWCRIRATTQFDSKKNPIKAVGVIVDIDREKKHEQSLLDQAQKDPLTGLFNKNTVRAKIEDFLEYYGSGAIHALMIIDLDNFKTINDRYGHLSGDAALSDVTAGLKKLFKYPCIMGRIGGDEFLVFLPDIRERSVAIDRARSILNALKQTFLRKNAVYSLSCSIGIALSPSDSSDYLGLYQCADKALYYTKNNGKDNFSFYDQIDNTENASLLLAQSAVNSNIDSDIDNLDQTLAQYTFRMLYNSVDIKTAVDQILEIVGRAYDVSRVYIFESSDDGLYCSNTFEWCNESISREKDNLQKLPYQGMSNYLDNFNDSYLFYCGDIKLLPPDLYSVLASQGIESLLQCAIVDNGQIKGFVGFDECRMNRDWTNEQIKSLSLVSNVLSTFLLKLRLEEKLKKYENLTVNSIN